MSSPFILSQQSINIIVVTVALITTVYYVAIFIYWLTQKFKHEGITEKVDHFLRIYILIAMLFTVLLWKFMKTNSGNLQREIVLTIFMITALIAIIAVLWRAQTINKFTHAPTTLKKPPSLLKKPYIYWPYFLILGFAGYVNINIILTYTVDLQNRGNRMIILKYFFLLVGFLIFCRVVSRCIDSVAIRNCGENDK